MKLLMCGCRQCKAGRKRKGVRTSIKRKRSRARSEVRVGLKTGEFDDLPTKIYIGYTDYNG